MTTIYNNFNVEAARSFKNTLAQSSNNTYFFLGKDSEWVDEGNPDGTPTIDADINKLHYDMILAKKVGAIDISLCILRHDWVSGNRYAQYDSYNPTLYTNSNFYVLTDDYNVYKCLSNNNESISTVKPTGTAISPFTTSDGYSWKFMFTIPQDAVAKFLNSQYIPVRDSAPTTDSQNRIQAQATRGAIESYSILSGGAGYTNASIEIIGDGVGALVIPEVNVAGFITGVRIQSIGRGYTWAEAIVTGTGEGAVIAPHILPGLGHGHNPANELGGHHVMISVDFVLDTSTSGINNPPSTFSFRRTGLITRPYDYDDSPVTSFSITACHKLYYTSSSRFKNGDVIRFEETDGTARIVEEGFDDEGSYLIINELSIPLLYDKNDPTRYSGDFRLVDDNAKSGTFSLVLLPDIRPNMYTTLYLDNRSKISTNPNQIETVRMVVEF